MKYLIQFARIIVGVIFIISGFVKNVDPIGLSFKLEEYFSPTVLNIPFLESLSLPLATFFSIFEIVLGVLLLLGVWKRFTTIFLLLTIIFFTFLTFYSAYFNKVTDCGCFGDALKLEPWTSFYKDVVLLVLIIILVVGQQSIKPLFVEKANYAINFMTILASAIIAYIGINHLPIIDFRPYAVGKDLIEGMKSPQELGLKPTTYKTIYTMKNSVDGKVVEIDDAQYIADDKWYKHGTPWVIEADKTRTIVEKKGYEPPIHDFSFDCNGIDKTSEILNAPKVIVFVVPFVEKVNEKQIEKLNILGKEASKYKGYRVVTVSNNPIKGLELENCFMDQTTMKTIIRSNPGVMILEKGTVKAKYHENDFPSLNQLEDLF
ncbi:DoxX family membrane protein [Empedobacter falsenii]